MDELELKLDQDERLVKEVGERFREECCEKQACQTDFAAMKKAIQERAALQQEMLQNRHRQHDTLQRSNAASTLRLSQVRTCASLLYTLKLRVTPYCLQFFFDPFACASLKSFVSVHRSACDFHGVSFVAFF